MQGRGETPLPADKRKFDVCFLVGCGEREKTRNMYIAVSTLFFVQLPNSPWDGSGDAATEGCVQGRGVTPLPADKRKSGGDCLGGCGERQKTRTHNQHFSLFVSKSHNSHPLSLQLQQLFSCSSSVVSLLWGDGGRAQKKSLAFPKNLFHFASHCSLLVSMECALHICSLACSHCTFVPHMIYMKRERKGGCFTHTHTHHTSFTHFTTLKCTCASALWCISPHPPFFSQAYNEQNEKGKCLCLQPVMMDRESFTN